MTAEERILEDVKNEEPCEFYYLNVFGIGPGVDDKDILDFYKSVKVLNVYHPNRESADLEFADKETLIRAIDLGTGSLRGQPFFIRSSYHNTRSAMPRRGRGGGRGGRGRGDRYGGGSRSDYTEGESNYGDSKYSGGGSRFGDRDRDRGRRYRDNEGEDFGSKQSSTLNSPEHPGFKSQHAKSPFEERGNHGGSRKESYADHPHTVGSAGNERSGVVRSRGRACSDQAEEWATREGRA